MNRLPIQSSNIDSIGYDESSQTLEIKFQSGGIYYYSNVPKVTYEGFITTDSKGSYFAKNIKESYKFTKGEYTPLPKLEEPPIPQITVSKPSEEGGRPTIITQETVSKLVVCFQRGWSDKNACGFARISRQTFYRHLKTDEEFSDIMTDAKSFWLSHAHNHITELLIDHTYKNPINEKLKIDTAKWVLEKKDPEEFGAKPANLVMGNQQNNFFNTADEFEQAIIKREAERKNVVEGEIINNGPTHTG